MMHELEEGISRLVHTINRLEQTMSALTDQVDQALTVLGQDSTNFGAALSASRAAQAVVQDQLDKANRGEVADAAELQKALEALQASHNALQANQGTSAGQNQTITVPPAGAPSPTAAPSPTVVTAPTAAPTAPPAPATAPAAPEVPPVPAADPGTQPTAATPAPAPVPPVA